MNFFHAIAKYTTGLFNYLSRKDKELFAFVICLVIASFIWMMTKLNQGYVQTLSFVINPVNIPDNVSVRRMQNNTASIQIEAQGFSLIFNKLKSKRSLTLDFSATPWGKMENNQLLYIPSRQLMNHFARQIPYSSAIIDIKPDTLFFRTDLLAQKKVPVVLNATYNFAAQYELHRPPVIEPDSVLISGPKTLLDTIHSVFSVQQNFSDIDGDVHAKVKLTPPLTDEIKINPKTIAVSLYAGRYTEKRFDLPVRLENNLSESAKIVPSKIELRCMVPLSDFQQVSANDFDVVAEIPNDKSAPSKIMLKIKRKHPAAKKIRLFPDAVEHFIIKQ